MYELYNMPTVSENMYAYRNKTRSIFIFSSVSIIYRKQVLFFINSTF